MADYWTQVRKNLEGLIARVRAGKYSLETAIKYANSLYRVKNGHLGVEDPEGDRAKEHGHYVRAFMDARAVTKGRRIVDEIRALGEKRLVPSNVANFYAEKARPSSPIFISPKEPQFIAPQQPPTPVEEKLNAGIEQVRDGKKKYATMVKEIMAVGPMILGQEKVAGLVNEAGMAAGFSPQYINEVAVPREIKLSSVWASMGIPQWIVERTIVPLYRHWRYGEELEETTIDDWRELQRDVARGKYPVESTIPSYLSSLPEDATFLQKIGAVAAGLTADVARDPWCWASVLGGFRVAIGTVANGVTNRTAGRWFKYAATHKPEVAKAATAMRDAALELLADRSFDVEAFTKGGGIEYVRAAFVAAARKGGLVKEEVAKWAAEEWMRIWQSGLKKQFRILGREIFPDWKAGNEIADIDKAIRAKQAKILTIATAKAVRRMAPTAAEQKLAQIANLPAATAYETKLADKAAEELTKMARGSDVSLSKIAETVRDFIVRTGNTPTVFNAPLGAMMGKYQRLSSVYAGNLARPLRGLTPADRDRVGELMALHPQVVRSKQFAERTGIPIGEVWEPPIADRVETALKMTGEWTGPEQVAKILDTTKALVDRLPPETKKLWIATDEMVKGFIGARQRIIDEIGIDVADKGPSYLTYRRAKPEYSRLSHVALPQAKQWFQRFSEYEHPVVVEWLRAAGHEEIPAAITDPLPLSIAYGHGMAKAMLHKDIAAFYKRYGVRFLNKQAAEVMGWGPPLQTVEAQYLDSIGKPSALSGLRSHYLPLGVPNYITSQLSSKHTVQKFAAKWGSISRQAALNTIHFPMINIPEQFFNAAVSGVPSLADPRNINTWRAAFRIAIEAMLDDTIEAGIASAPRTFGERLSLGVARGGTGLSDVIDKKLSIVLQDNVVMDNVRKFLKIQKISENDIAETLTWLKQTDVLHGGYAANLGRYEARINDIADAVLRNTIGWGIRSGGAIEDFARSAAAAAMHLSGLSDADTTRRLTAGFVPYGRAWQSTFSDWMRAPSYFFTYGWTRPGQVANAVIERPWLAYLPARMAQSAYDTMFNDEGQITLRGRDKYLRLNPKYRPVNWDAWPISMHKEKFPDWFRERFVPNLAIPYPGLDVVGDVSSRLGLTSERDPSLTGAALRSIHPWLRAAGEAWHGNTERAFEIAFPIVTRARRWSKLARPPTYQEILDVYDKYHISLAGKSPDPTVTEELWKMMQAENTIRETTGFFVSFQSVEGMLDNLSLDDKEWLNQVRTGKNKPPLLYSNQQQTEAAERAVALGHPPPTLKDMNDLLGQGITTGAWLATEKKRAEAARVSQLGFDDWRKENARRRQVNEDYLPITENALRELNKRRASADPVKFPPYTPEQVMALEHLSVPTSLPAGTRMARGAVSSDVGMCARTMWESYFGKTGYGDAEEAPGVWAKEGFTTLPQGTPISEGKAGDAIWYPLGEHGHTGWLFVNPKSKQLELLSNYEGQLGFSPLQDIPGTIISRPPPMNAFEYELQRLR